MATLKGKIWIKFTKILWKKILIIPRGIIKDTNPHPLPEKAMIILSFNYVNY